jgi:acetyl-CoA synthase
MVSLKGEGMSQPIITAAMKGAADIVEQASQLVRESTEKLGVDAPVVFPNTAYYLPVIYGFSGQKVERLGDLSSAVSYACDLLPATPSEEAIQNIGIATLIAEEAIEGIRFAEGKQPETHGGYLFNGPIDDAILRALGVQLADGTISGVAAIIGAAKSNQVAVKLIRELQSKGLLTVLAGNVNGRSMAGQLLEEGIELGAKTLIIPLGFDTISAVYALGYASRLAFSFGGIKAGESEQVLLWNRQRAPVFVLALGEIDELKCATAAGALSYGFPLIADSAIPGITPFGKEQIVSVPFDDITGIDDTEKAEELVRHSLEVRGIKARVSELALPIAYGSAFEGEVVRRPDMQIEFGGKGGTCFEWLTMRDMDEVQDGKISIVGTDPFTLEAGTNVPLGIVVEVSGQKMEKDFEPVLERQIHHFMNGAEGIQHQGQRDITWIRISKASVAKGFNMDHLGHILHTKLHEQFGTLADKVQVTFYTEPDKVKELMEKARGVYQQRNERASGLTDEAADTFYSCTLCQSFAPNHVCVINPERVGLCGAYNWLDCKAAYEINPKGANQPVLKGKLIDAVRGEWEGVNEFVYEHSNRSVERFTMYSIIDAPMTTCGCCECAISILPEANGFLVISRDDYNMTPCGMTFSTLMGMMGGGHQTPGMMGCGKYYLTSDKFISAEGGIKRVVWMSKNLKEEMKQELNQACQREGVPDLLDKIADHTVATTIDDLLPFLEQRGHPALTMEPLL